MTVATFDTLKYANTLKAVGVPDKQAEAQATVLFEALAINLKDLVTKDDLRATEQKLDAKIDLLRTELKADLRESEQRLDSKIDSLGTRIDGQITLLKWMFGVSTTFFIAVVALLARLVIRLP